MRDEFLWFLFGWWLDRHPPLGKIVAIVALAFVAALVGAAIAWAATQ